MPALRAVAMAFAVLTLWGCERSEPPPAAPPAVDTKPVVVYAAYRDNSYLPGLLEEFSDRTGVIVTVRTGSAESLVTDLIEKKVVPPADLLLTGDVHGVWQAAEEGMLRPLQSPLVTARIAPWLRDADGYWTALSYRSAEIVYDPAEVSVEDLKEPRALAEPQFRGRLCLARPENSISLAIIAHWIDKLGLRETELLVRGWVGNLAEPAFATEAGVLDAIAAGRCAVGIVSMDTYAAVATMREVSYRSISPTTRYADVEAIGIARHARNPDGARALVEWLLSDSAERPLLEDVLAHAATTSVQDPDKVGVVAVQREAAIRLAERARYR